MLGLCYILSTTSHAWGVGGVIDPPVRCAGHSRGVTGGATTPPVRGPGQCPKIIFFGPYFSVGGPAHGFVHAFTHGFGA